MREITEEQLENDHVNYALVYFWYLALSVLLVIFFLLGAYKVGLVTLSGINTQDEVASLHKLYQAPGDL